MNNDNKKRNSGASIFGLTLILITLFAVAYLLFFSKDGKDDPLAQIKEKPEISAELPDVYEPQTPASAEDKPDVTSSEVKDEKKDNPAKEILEKITDILPGKDKEEEKPAEEPHEGYPDLTDCDIILLGDSIFAMCEDDSTVGNKLAELTGANVYTVSKSGATAAEGYYDMCTLPVITEVFLGNGALNANGSALADSEISRYWQDDHTGRRTIFIFDCAINDYAYSAPIENGATDGTSMKSAYRNTINRLHEVYPEATGVIMIPAYYTAYNSGHDVNAYGFTMYDYRVALKEIASEFSMVLIDAYENSGINENNAGQMLADGLHPTEMGREALAELLANGLWDFNKQ